MSKLKVDEIRSADRSVSDSANITLTDAGGTKLDKLNVDEIRSADRSVSDSANITLTDAGFTLTNFIGFSARVASGAGTFSKDTWSEVGSASNFSSSGSPKWNTDVNVGSVFNTDTGRFTPTIAGVYLVTASFDWGRLDSEDTFYSVISKNGSYNPNYAIAFERQTMGSINNRGNAQSIAGMVSMNGSNDYLSLHIYHTCDTASTLNQGTTFSATFIGKT